MARLRVDFPQPEFADQAEGLAGPHGEITPSTARTIPIGRRRMPLATGKWTCSARTSSSGATSVMAPRRGCRAHTATRRPLRAGRKQRRDLLAGLEGLRAARPEAAAGRGLQGIRNVSADHIETAAARHAEPRNRRHQGARERMLRRAQHVAHPAAFDDAAGIHHGDMRAHLGDDAEIVRDEHKRHAVARLLDPQKIENLRLDGGVEGSRRLVRDEHLRLAGKRHRDHRPLLHSARELVRILPGAPFGRRDADLPQQGDGAAPGSAARGSAMQMQALRHLIADRPDGVERAHRVLEDHGDVAPADRAQRLFRKCREIAPFEEIRDPDARRRGDDKPAASRREPSHSCRNPIPDEAQSFGGADGQTDIANDARLLPRLPNHDTQVLDDERQCQAPPMSCSGTFHISRIVCSGKMAAASEREGRPGHAAWL